MNVLARLDVSGRDTNALTIFDDFTTIADITYRYLVSSGNSRPAINCFPLTDPDDVPSSYPGKANSYIIFDM